MGNSYRLSYDSIVVSLADQLVQSDPIGAWEVVRKHLAETHADKHDGLCQWLQGGLWRFDESEPRGAISYLPLENVLDWIDDEPKYRAQLMAHAAPGTLDDTSGGRLTRELLHRYGHIESVRNIISGTFNSGGWSGPASAHLRRKRDRLRQWLSAGIEPEVCQWIENELEEIDRRIEWEEIDEERSRFD
jgi:hypothetical protein